jgi:hypothetical protein
MARRVYLCMTLLYGIELLLSHHWLAAPGVALLIGMATWPVRARRARSLRLASDGTWWLQWHTGTWEQMGLHPGSLRLGDHLLVVLQGSSGIQRLVLGPDNLAPRELAALRRRLRAGPMAGASALHSVAAPGSQSSELP